MKKILPFLSLAFVLVLFSCKKSSKSEAQPKEKLYPVSFSASDFQESSKTMSKALAVDSAKKVFKKLVYGVYNSSGNLLRTINQDVNTTANFGTIIDSLPAGSYSAAFIGSSGTIATSGFSSSTSARVDNNNNDIFLKRINFIVNGPLVNESVILERIVGKMTIVLKDIIPSNVTKLVVEYEDGTQLYINGSSSSYWTGKKTYTYTITTADRAAANYTISNFVLPNLASTSVNIRAYTTTNTLVVDKTINNVSLTKNKETLVTGSLFNTVNHEGGFTIFADQAWDSSKTVVEF